MSKQSTILRDIVALCMAVCLCACGQVGTSRKNADMARLQEQNDSLRLENRQLFEKVEHLDSLLRVQETKNKAYDVQIKDLWDDLEGVIGFLNEMGY